MCAVEGEKLGGHAQKGGEHVQDVRFVFIRHTYTHTDTHTHDTIVAILECILWRIVGMI